MNLADAFVPVVLLLQLSLRIRFHDDSTHLLKLQAMSRPVWIATCDAAWSRVSRCLRPTEGPRSTQLFSHALRNLLGRRSRQSHQVWFELPCKSSIRALRTALWPWAVGTWQSLAYLFGTEASQRGRIGMKSAVAAPWPTISRCD